jgi:hypothetical protein
MKFIDFGIVNKWLIRTETEWEDGSECEEKGIKGPIKFHSIYLRVWLGKVVFMLGSKGGLKKKEG